MKKICALQLVLLLSLRVLADPAFTTKQVPVNRGGQDGGMVTLVFYDDMPTVPYIGVAEFQKLMLPGTTIEVTMTGEGEYLLKGPFAEATVNTTTEVFASGDYMGFTNLMGQLQPGMANVYYDGAPFVRYSSQQLTPSAVTVTFEFQKYGIDLRADQHAVYFPLATLSDIYSDLYYHVAGYNGETVDVVTENQNANIVNFDPEGTKRVLSSESRGADMAAYSYGELCFVVDHFYGMPGRSPLEEAIRSKGLDAALDGAENGATIKKLLKSTDMQEYIFGMDCLHLLLQDGGHTMTLVDMMANQALEEMGETVDESLMENIAEKYPELAATLQQYVSDELMYSPKMIKLQAITSLRPAQGTYYKQGDTAYLMFDTFGMTNDAAWKAYYDGGCQGPLPEINDKFKGDLAVVLDALKKADEDPEVKNFVVDLSCNLGGSLDVVMAMTALLGGQSHFYSENLLTGQRQIISYDVDTNFDGVFDQNDKVVRHNLNVGVLTTDIAFSCGNLFPSLMKDMGFPIIGEKSGGGACAIQQFITPEGLQYQLSSARARLTNKQWENIDGGVEPDYPIELVDDEGMMNYLALYDVPTIGSYIAASASQGGTGGEMATVTAKGMYYDQDLTLDVTKTADGSIALYDQKRNIYTVNGAKIPEVESSKAANEIVNDKQKLEKTLQSAVATFAPGEPISAYMLKSVRIDEMTNPATGQSLMPTANAPLASLGLVMTYKGTQTVHLWDCVSSGASASPIVYDVEAEKHIIPREGVSLMIGAGKAADGSDMSMFMVDVTPDGSGTFAFDQNGVKGVLTYEPAPNYVADIHWGMARTYDFYKNVLGRDSYDDNGSPIYNVAYPSGVATDAGANMDDMPDDNPQNEGLSGHGLLRRNAPSSSNPGEMMGVIAPLGGQSGAEAMSNYSVYLIAYGTGYLSNYYNFVIRPAGELSVMCHEFTHLVTKSTAQLSSSGEGGALNESFSDIMAISLMKNAEYGIGSETPWVVGGNGLIMGADHLRNLGNPKNTRDGKAPAPDTYKGTYWDAKDKYGMSAVQSYFYYLLSDGGNGTNDQGTAYDVTGIGIEKATKIAYLTLTKYCSENSDYSNIRESWMKAAQELYGENSAEVQTVGKAWTAVGIGGTDPSGIQELPAVPAAADGHWYTLDGRRLSGQPTTKGAYIHNGRKVIR